MMVETKMKTIGVENACRVLWGRAKCILLEIESRPLVQEHVDWISYSLTIWKTSSILVAKQGRRIEDEVIGGWDKRARIQRALQIFAGVCRSRHIAFWLLCSWIAYSFQRWVLFNSSSLSPLLSSSGRFRVERLPYSRLLRGTDGVWSWFFGDEWAAKLCYDSGVTHKVLLKRIDLRT